MADFQSPAGSSVMHFSRVTTVVAVLIAASAAAFAQGRRMQSIDTSSPVGGSAFHKNDITYSTSVATPHINWATKLPGGPIKGFFIPSVEFGRDMVEVMQRLDLQPTTVTIDRNWDTNCW